MADSLLMGCSMLPDVRRMIRGELGRASVLKLMDHARTCEECHDDLCTHRSPLLNGSSTRPDPRPTSSSVEREERQSPARSVATQWPEGRERLFGSQNRSRSRGRILLIGSAIAMALLSFFGADRGGSGDQDLSADELYVARELSHGRPVMESPEGVLHNRPVVAAAILPPGEPFFDLHISRNGQDVLVRTFRADSDGASFDDVDRKAADGSVGATEAMVPFPPASELELEDGVTYSLSVRLANGHASAPLTFTYQR